MRIDPGPSRLLPSQPSTPSRRALLRGGGALLLAGGLGSLGSLGGCAGFGVPDRHDISRDRILAALSEHFPLRKRLLDAFELTVSLPRLRLLPQENRLQTDFDLAVTENLLMRRTFRGAMGIASGVRYEPVDHSVRLTRVRLDRFAMADLPALLNQPLQEAGGSLVEMLLENLSVYRLPDRTIRLIDGAGLVPRELTVQADGLSIGFDRRPG